MDQSTEEMLINQLFILRRIDSCFEYTNAIELYHFIKFPKKVSYKYYDISNEILKELEELYLIVEETIPTAQQLHDLYTFVKTKSCC